MPFEFVADPDPQECNRLVLNHHYSHLVPTVVTYRAALYDDQGCAAAVMFGVPATRWSQPIRELLRLVRRPDVKPPLTQLIGKACRELKRRKLADLVVSFADSTQGHHGGVYQAASWNYHEQRKPQNDGFLIDGEFVHRRVCNHRFGTSSRVILAGFFDVWGSTFDVHMDKGKHLYWRALSAKGEEQARALGLEAIPYFKEIA